MKSSMGWAKLLAVLVSLALAGCGSGYPAAYLSEEVATQVHCYPATGHTVSGNFLRYFEAMGGIESLGLPITEPLEQDGRLVQYFEYARLEDHPDNPGRPVVKLSMLGEQLGRRQPPLSPSRVPPASERTTRYYPPMGHALTGDFLTYFDGHGGLERFGFPIAEPIVVGGRLVQDFQRARFEWHADRAPGERVTLEPIGRIFFEAQGLDTGLLAPVECL
jgi:hypothetical protein